MRVALFTFVDFWRRGAGHRERIFSLISYLQQVTPVVVYYYGNVTPDDYKAFGLFPKVKFQFFDGQRHTLAQFAGMVGNSMKKIGIKVCIVEYIELSFLLDIIPKNTKVFLDTHDLKSEREDHLKVFGLRFRPFTWADELKIMRQYDKVLAICKPDYQRISRNIGVKRTILVSHAAVFTKKKVRRIVRNIGFVASEYAPNVEGLIWFIRSVLPRIKHSGIRYNVFGNIKHVTRFGNPECIVFHGFVPNLEDVYFSQDIIISPVRFGAGIKIKNLEAIANGLPLVTTPHGARGLELAAERKALLICKNEQEFAEALDSLIDSFTLRNDVASEAYKYAREFHSWEACYEPILNELKKHELS